MFTFPAIGGTVVFYRVVVKELGQCRRITRVGNIGIGYIQCKIRIFGITGLHVVAGYVIVRSCTSCLDIDTQSRTHRMVVICFIAVDIVEIGEITDIVMIGQVGIYIKVVRNDRKRHIVFRNQSARYNDHSSNYYIIIRSWINRISLGKFFTVNFMYGHIDISDIMEDEITLVQPVREVNIRCHAYAHFRAYFGWITDIDIDCKRTVLRFIVIDCRYRRTRVSIPGCKGKAGRFACYQGFRGRNVDIEMVRTYGKSIT